MERSSDARNAGLYNRDLNACINIAHALTRGMGWGSLTLNQMRLEAQNPLNAGSLSLQSGEEGQMKRFKFVYKETIANIITEPKARNSTKSPLWRF